MPLTSWARNSGTECEAHAAICHSVLREAHGYCEPRSLGKYDQEINQIDLDPFLSPLVVDDMYAVVYNHPLGVGRHRPDHQQVKQDEAQSQGVDN